VLARRADLLKVGDIIFSPRIFGVLHQYLDLPRLLGKIDALLTRGR
jgi:hypothetical protein